MAPVVGVPLRLQPIAPPHGGGDTEQIDPSVVGMRARSDVVWPVELSVHHHGHLIAHPSAAGDDVGDAPGRRAVVERHSHCVEWDPRCRRMAIRGAAACARQVATGDADVADRLSTACDAKRPSREGRDRTKPRAGRTGKQRAHPTAHPCGSSSLRSPVATTGGSSSTSNALDAATTPRNK